MRIVVLGATGRTGRHVVEQAIDRGHTVTAVVRDPTKLRVAGSEPLDVVTADVMDPAHLAPVLESHDAVVSALGPNGNGPTTTCTDSARSITAAMSKSGLTRLVVTSAAGISTDGDPLFVRWVVKPILNRILRHPFNDMRELERIVVNSGLDWTIVRPPQLTDRPYTGRFRVNESGSVRGGYRMPRADLAHALLDAAADPNTVTATLSVAT
ncbi:NAD(P)H-binding protein [Haloactinopolyspora sp.]|uniref:NAD(P)-dependent oxidoreductase n=1 Tax=Haloactinopolyspora sp. TaxID=1966353 RepID=UPI00260F89EF|nr:NAD(P)H-binding protein [Haloactinopolyspora sp.]